MLIQVCGLPGTGKSTLSARIADARPLLLLRIDAIEGAMWQNGLTADQTGIAAYSVAHAVAEPHLRRGQDVLADAVSAVEPARAGWRATAAALDTPLCVIETVCPDPHEHRRRVETRTNDLVGFTLPTWADVDGGARTYEPRTDDRLVLDTREHLDDCVEQALAYISRCSGAG